MIVYKFRINNKISDERFRDFIDVMADILDMETFPEHLVNLFMQYNRSRIGRVVTTNKCNADEFINFLCGLPCWNPEPHPMKWKIEQ